MKQISTPIHELRLGFVANVHLEDISRGYTMLTQTIGHPDWFNGIEALYLDVINGQRLPKFVILRPNKL